MNVIHRDCHYVQLLRYGNTTPVGKLLDMLLEMIHCMWKVKIEVTLEEEKKVS